MPLRVRGGMLHRAGLKKDHRDDRECQGFHYTIKAEVSLGEVVGLQWRKSRTEGTRVSKSWVNFNKGGTLAVVQAVIA